MAPEVILDPDSPYAELKLSRNEKGYYLIDCPADVPAHAIVRNNGKVLLHRAVHYDAIGSGPHACQWCKWEGLRWDLDSRDPDYLQSDHIDGNKANCQRSNLAAAHGWCNSNRSVIESEGLPWDLPEIGGTEPVKRRHLKNTKTLGPTEYAKKLKAQLTQPAPLVEVAPKPRAGRKAIAPTRPLREGYPSWGQALDPTPPSWLQDAHPWLLEELGCG